MLNSFRFLESDDDINKFSSEDIYQTDFFSVKATIMLGTTATTDLEKLLLDQKDAIDDILKSQPVSVLEKLSALFDHKYKIEEQMVEPMEEDTSGSNYNHNDPSKETINISNRITNGDVEMSNGNGNGDDGNSNEDGGEGGDGGGGGDGDGDEM
ncbi:hypothetical protein Glove_86g136 [Diversispora epigaea]|uniref:Uncharacterized protein n=1 Tax=Diversispora epigaea TaxID=1348612 RepID=A0A397JG82_9GLOM|nr:hypothetical protein Glove_86g136 [Diversispora epigaea]